MGILDFITKTPNLQTLDLKKAFDAARYGQAGVPAWPEADRQALMQWPRRNELVYACIRKKCEAASDAELLVEKRTAKGEWETVEGHPCTSLLNKPNPQDTSDTFLSSWIASEETTGDFYAEIIRQGSIPVALYPLDPSCMHPIPDKKGGIAYYEFHSGYSPIIRLETADVLHRRKPDLASRYYGLAPLRVAIGSVDADNAQTDFVRAFFHSDGIPAGLLKVLNRSMSQEEANKLQQGWMAKFRRGGSNYKQVAVLDQNAEFQKIGTNLSEIEGETTRGQVESRICMVFGVPPALVGAYVGLNLATNNATMRTHMEDFWFNTMSPLMKALRVYLTWNLLPEFESIDLIKAGKIRVNWDVNQVMALQEDEDKRHDRARKNFTAGGWTINEFREATGLEPLDGEDYFVQPKSIDLMTDIVRALVAQREPPEPPDPNEAIDAEVMDEPKQIEDGSKALCFCTKTYTCGIHDGDGQVNPVKIGASRAIRKAIESELSKTFDYDGLTLSREPTDNEKRVDLKGLANAYESGKSRLSRVLFAIRDDLIDQSTEAVKQHEAGEMYALTLTPPVTAQKKIRKEIDAAFQAGREQVAKELSGGKALEWPETKKTDFASKIARLVDIVISRIVNEVQTRAVNVFTSLGTLGLDDDEIIMRLKDTLDEQSLKAFESFASQAVNAAVNAGRDAEAADRKDEWDRVEYSAILDKNTCEACEEADGKSAADVDDLPPAPNDDCEGAANCRCFHIFVGVEGNA